MKTEVEIEGHHRWSEGHLVNYQIPNEDSKPA